MEIKNFVKKTLVDFVKAVDEANKEIAKTGIDCRVGTLTHHNDSPLVRLNGKFYTVRDCEMDIAVTVTAKKTAKGSASITVLGVGADLASESSTASRIKYSIPIAIVSDFQK